MTVSSGKQSADAVEILAMTEARQLSEPQDDLLLYLSKTHIIVIYLTKTE
jgi:hypothetical protein